MEEKEETNNSEAVSEAAMGSRFEVARWPPYIQGHRFFDRNCGESCNGEHILSKLLYNPYP